MWKPLLKSAIKASVVVDTGFSPRHPDHMGQTSRSLTTFVLCALITVLTGCASFRQHNSEEARLHHRVGMGHLENGNLPQAFSSLLEAEKIDGDDPGIQNSLGLAYYLREKFDLAEKHFQKALSLKSDYSDAKNNLARTWIELKQYDRALKLLDEVMNDVTYTNPEKPLLNAGIANFRKGEFRRAQDFFRKSLSMDRESCLAQSFYGRALYELKDFPSAASALDRAVGFCQKIQFDEPHYFSALAYYHSGDEARATARLEEVTKLYPGGTYNAKAQTLLKQLRK